MNVKQLDKEYVANTYARFPLQIANGKGSLVYDEAGKEYIDLGTGIAVNTFGVSDSEWTKAVTAQLSTLQHMSNLYYTEPCTRLAKLLCEKTGMKKVFFSNSGAEANECAIKTARKYAADTKGAEYNTIVTLTNSFHGRTITTLAATGQEVFHKDFLPLTEGFVYAEANNVSDLEAKVKENKCAAIMLECIQGEGGVLPLTEEFVAAIKNIAEKENLLIVVDEVQTGNGRTGKLYAYMHYGLNPDIVSTAKGLAGGLPLGATMLGERVKDTLQPGSHGSTFGGNPVCAAGACSVLERLTDEVLAGVSEREAMIREALKGADGVVSITGMGLMLGIETVKDASAVIAECMQNGVLVIKAKNKVRLLPALNIPKELLQKALDVIKNACKQEN